MELSSRSRARMMDWPGARSWDMNSGIRLRGLMREKRLALDRLLVLVVVVLSVLEI